MALILSLIPQQINYSGHNDAPNISRESVNKHVPKKSLFPFLGKLAKKVVFHDIMVKKNRFPAKQSTTSEIQKQFFYSWIFPNVEIQSANDVKSNFRKSQQPLWAACTRILVDYFKSRSDRVIAFYEQLEITRL